MKGRGIFYWCLVIRYKEEWQGKGMLRSTRVRGIPRGVGRDMRKSGRGMVRVFCV